MKFNRNLYFFLETFVWAVVARDTIPFDWVIRILSRSAWAVDAL